MAICGAMICGGKLHWAAVSPHPRLRGCYFGATGRAGPSCRVNTQGAILPEKRVSVQPACGNIRKCCLFEARQRAHGGAGRLEIVCAVGKAPGLACNAANTPGILSSPLNRKLSAHHSRERMWGFQVRLYPPMADASPQCFLGQHRLLVGRADRGILICGLCSRH